MVLLNGCTHFEGQVEVIKGLQELLVLQARIFEIEVDGESLGYLVDLGLDQELGALHFQHDHIEALVVEDETALFEEVGQIDVPLEDDVPPDFLHDVLQNGVSVQDEDLQEGDAGFVEEKLDFIVVPGAIGD